MNGDKPAATSDDIPPAKTTPQPKSQVSWDPSSVRPATRPMLPDSEACLRDQRLQEEGREATAAGGGDLASGTRQTQAQLQ